MSTVTLPAEPLATVSPDQNGAISDESLYEVVHGQRVEMPSMGVRSVWVNSRLLKHLANHVDDHQLGTVVAEGLFILDAAADERRCPDLAFVSARTWPLDREIPMEGDWQVVPDLAVEVISPNDLFEAVLTKIDEYFDYGVKLVWVVSPATEKVYVYESPVRVRVLTVAEELEGGELLPGFRLRIAALFHRSVPNA